MPATYHYIGASELAIFEDELPSRVLIRSAEDVRCRAVSQTVKRNTFVSIVATFIIAENGDLWIADRQSEHVQCARGLPVLSAGEMSFDVGADSVSVSAVTNQSTGYCPDGESWPAVTAALHRAGLPHPPFWTTAFVFRHCPSCGMTNIVKEGIFECGVCGSELPR